MAGEAAGQQGEVRVWSPDANLIRRHIWAFGAAIAVPMAVMVGLSIAFHTVMFSGLGGLILPFMLLGPALAARRRPCYITTDDVGIGVTTRKSSRALRWEEIASIETGDRHWIIGLESGEKIWLNVVGYTPGTLHALKSLVEVQANLYPHPTKRQLFVHGPLMLPPGSARKRL